ncbi:MAG: pyridoxine 5-phosphate synthase [Planctomycetota bacterium]|jgi:pyridoxine 5-phosphate synthase
MQTNFSVNINKIALLRNARGENLPDLIKFAKDCIAFGVDGITVHPRPDERHITKKDVYDLADFLPNKNCEFNIEGYPSEDFVKMVLEVKPNQCTLVPDSPGQLTSDHGWDTIKDKELLLKVIPRFQEKGISVSLFIGTDKDMIQGAKDVSADRIEFYTGPFAAEYAQNKENSIALIKEAAIFCNEIGIGVNAGHDLNLENLKFLKENIVDLLEVSIGQAFVRDCLYLGLENTIQLYKRLLV